MASRLDWLGGIRGRILLPTVGLYVAISVRMPLLMAEERVGR